MFERMVRRIRREFDRRRLKDPHWAMMFDEDPSGEVVSIDCETTGFDLKTDEVIYVSAIRVAGNRILTSSAFNAMIRPESAAMRAEAIRVHQLRAVDVENGRPMREVIPELLDFIGGRPVVGYWIDYDVSMLDRCTSRAFGFRLPNRRIEVSELYYGLKYGNAPQGTQIDLSFNAIARDLGLRELPAHDAFNDALSAAEMYVQLTDMRARGRTIARERLDEAAAGISY
ncbi:3'-5' exonuclease [Pinisolibacter sp.]|uniref:3'-5' exonuclease n=1 Tax=Pinisolibacter sp. TaxID=2172024 RepID=UPI002FDED4F6